jgi:hypothetical protein
VPSAGTERLAVSVVEPAEADSAEPARSVERVDSVVERVEAAAPRAAATRSSVRAQHRLQ